MVRAGALIGNGTFDVRGGVANTNTLNDAAGAGAGGGSVVLISPNWTSGVITVNGQGGQGGDSWLTGGSAHSGGGGGGGGLVVRSGAVSANLSGGPNGITNIVDNPPGGSDHGALPGTLGVELSIAPASDPVTNAGYLCAPQVDVAIAKSANPAAISLGGTTTFTLVISNSGPQTATNTTVLDVLPASLNTITWVSATAAGGSSMVGTSLVSLSSLAATLTLPINSTVTFVFQAVGASAGNLPNIASATVSQLAQDSNLANNVSSASVVVGPTADLSATKAASTPSLNIGQTTQFTLVLSNAGPNGVTNAAVQDILPSGLSGVIFLSSTGSSSGTLTTRTTSGTQFNGTVTLPANSSVTINFSAAAGGIGSQVNNATITAPVGTIDPNPSNNIAQATVTIPVPALLSISKSDGSSSVAAGSSVSYSIVVTNDGPNSAANTIVKDPASTGLICTSVTCSTTGGALCPSPLTIGLIQGAGLSIPAFPANSVVTFVLGCGVSATGQ